MDEVDYELKHSPFLQLTGDAAFSVSTDPGLFLNCALQSRPAVSLRTTGHKTETLNDLKPSVNH